MITMKIVLDKILIIAIKHKSHQEYVSDESESELEATAQFVPTATPPLITTITMTMVNMKRSTTRSVMFLMMIKMTRKAILMMMIIKIILKMMTAVMEGDRDRGYPPFIR